MKSDFPEPFVPADCDLRGLPFMPLDVIRLLDSDLFALSTGDEFKASVALWCKSWNQVPAASLPNDDRVLAHLSGAKNWKKVKAGAMRGWTLCSDGRWYHPVVAEKAIEALPMRQEFEQKKSSENDRKARERKARKEMFELLRAHGVVPDWNTSTKQLRELAQQYQSQTTTDADPDMSQPVTLDDTNNVTAPVTTCHEQVTAKTGTGTVKGQGQGLNKEKNSTPELGVTTLPPDGGAEPPDSENLGAIDDKAIVFEMGKPALVRLGMDKAAAGSMVGKCIKEAGIDGAMRICGRLATFEKHPNPAALVMTLIKEEKDPVFVWLREKHGDCRTLPGGRYAAGGRFFDSEGRPEVVL